MKKEKPLKELTLLQKLEKTSRDRNIEKFTQQSYDWYKKKAKEIFGGAKLRKKIVDEQTKRGMSLDRNPGIGNMYTFIYDAKHKDTLPYWDAFPLVFMVHVDSKTFHALNLHYLSPRYRAVLLDRLIDLSSSSKYTTKTKLKLTYGLLKGASKYKLFKPCYKQYLYSHLGSKLVKIPSQEWEAALFLPLANFQKSSNSKVWSDSVLMSK